MLSTDKKNVSPFVVIVAFATVYLVWGSTYFFIQKAIQEIPPFLMGALRFIIAGLLLMIWCIIKGDRVWVWTAIKRAALIGLLMPFIGNGAVIWAEQSLPSSLVAVLVSAAPIWFVLLDKPKWKENFKSRETILGLIVGFIGVILLFGERIIGSETGNGLQLVGLIILVIGSISWAAGSLFSKYKEKSSSSVNIAWQMIAGGFAFLSASLVDNEWNGFQWQTVTMQTWLSLLYLILLGSIAAYSAYVWLLQVRSATQVSTYAYVNPIVAILLGAFVAGEKITLMQLVGLAVILTSVLLINLAKYRNEKQLSVEAKPDEEKKKPGMIIAKKQPVCDA
jgi:drug/metabolite transporter (DMT)-like permease